MVGSNGSAARSAPGSPDVVGRPLVGRLIGQDLLAEHTLEELVAWVKANVQLIPGTPEFVKLMSDSEVSIVAISNGARQIAEPMLAHRAIAQGEMVAEVITNERRAAFDKVAIPAVCFTSPEVVVVGLSPAEARQAAVERYLALLRAGGSDHPMILLERAGVDLREPHAVQAVVDGLDVLVGRLEGELHQLGDLS